MFNKYLSGIAVALSIIGGELKAYDTNNEGNDDFAGELLTYASDVIAAILAGEDLPPFPEILAKGTSGRISGQAALTLRIASGLLTFGQVSVGPKYSVAIKYIRQTINNLLAGRPAVPPPDALTRSSFRPYKNTEEMVAGFTPQNFGR